MIVDLKFSDADIERIAEAVARRLGAQPTSAEDADALLSIKEAAARLRCSERHLRSLIKIRRLRAVKLSHGGGARVRIRRSEVERLIAQSTH